MSNSTTALPPSESEAAGLFDVLAAKDPEVSQSTARAAEHGGHTLTNCMHRLMMGAQAPSSEVAVMELLEDGLAALAEVTGAELGALLVLDEDTGDLAFALTHGEIPREKLAWMRVPKGAGIAQWVVTARRPATINDARTDDRFFPKVDQYTGVRTRSVVAAPLLWNDKVFGVIELLNKPQGALFTVSDQNHVCLICHFAARLLARLICADSERFSLVS